MPQPYLIAHLVRGEPAFDIAIQLQIGDEDGWIIPTSGHRAYPFFVLPLNEMMVMKLEDNVIRFDWITDKPAWGYGSSSIPRDSSWPDHYTPSAAPKGQGKITNLLAKLGMAKPLNRRI